MRFSCTQENFHSALGLIGHIAARQGSLPILSNVLLRAEEKSITLTATNLELAMTFRVRGKVEEDGAMTVNAKLTTDVVGLLPKDRVDVQTSGSEIEIKCRGSSTKVRGMDAAEFPLIPEVKRGGEVLVEVTALRNALGRVSFAAASGESRPELSGVLFRLDGTTAVLAATDSYRLAQHTLPLRANAAPKGTTIIVPNRTVQELLRALGQPEDDAPNEVTIIPTQNQLFVSLGNLGVTSRLIDGTYPDYTQILPRSWATRVCVSRAELQATTRAASLFARTGVNDIHLRVLPKEGQLIVRS